MGTLTSLVFAVRNGAKCVKQGDKTRGAVAACQTVGTLDNVSQAASSSIFSNISSKAGSILSKADGAVETIFSKIDKTGTVLDDAMKTTGATTKIGAIAQKAVNPLLCVSAGVRVLKDDDQYAALIEEGAAMSTMFTVESAMKYLRSGTTGSQQATTGLAGKVAKALGGSNKISSAVQKLNEKYQSLASTSNGSTKQLLVRLGMDALFVAGSILAYNAGHKIGEALSHRNSEKTT